MRSHHWPERISPGCRRKAKRKTEEIRDVPHVMTVELTFQHDGSYAAFWTMAYFFQFDNLYPKAH